MSGEIIDTIIFDFGGTLDTDGIHWSRKFFDIFIRNNIVISHDDFIKAYIYAERNAAANIKPQDSFFNTLNAKISLQFSFIINEGIINKNNLYDKKELVIQCYKDVISTIQDSREILNNLSKKFKLGIASNFYGNLETVLEEFSLIKYFSYAFDSAVEGIRKPDPEVFNHTLAKLGSSCVHSAVIGDSYSKDIEPAKRIGCTTIWLLNKPFNETNPNNTADYIISSLCDLSKLDILKK